MRPVPRSQSTAAADRLATCSVAPYADAIKQHFADGGYAASCADEHDAA
jgi:hypothetical protein